MPPIIDLRRIRPEPTIRTVADMEHPPLTRRHALAAAGALSVLVAGILLAEALPAGRPSTALLVTDLVVGLLACAVAPWALFEPRRAAVVLAVLSAVAPTATPAAATAVLWTARRRRLGDAVGVAALGVGSQVILAVWRPSAGGPTGWWLLAVVLGFGATVGWGAWMQARRDLLDATADHARRAERTRIAREMHDTLAHRLSLLATFAGALEYNPSAPPEQLSAAAATIRSASHEALEELREVIGVLRDDEVGGEPTRPQPTLRDLPALVDEARQSGTDVDLDVHLATHAVSDIPDRLGRTCYRIVQESLTNARKHAPGQPVRVAVRADGNILTIAIENPMTGRPDRHAVPGAGVGLVGMRERTELVGGRLVHGPVADRYRVEASLPWPS